jgi:paraquat-inducible protein B
MAAPANYVKIGLLVVLGFVAATTLALFLGFATTHRKTLAYATYFEEPVTGLDVGAPVRARGVSVGRVKQIEFAPQRGVIEVQMDVEPALLGRFGGVQASGGVHPELRAQLASQGITTGSRFVSIDYFDPKAEPPPELSFSVPERYIPAAKSRQKTLEDSVTRAMEGVANLVDALSREGFSEKAAGAMARIDEALATLDRLLVDFDREGVPRRLTATLDQLRGAVRKVDGALDRVDGDAGLIATTQRSVSSFGEVERNAIGATRGLDQTLDEIREAAAAIRLLASELEREPDALLKGREKASPR